MITKYRSTAMTMSVIMEQMPNKAPQNAYNSQPGDHETAELAGSVQALTNIIQLKDDILMATTL